MISSPLDFVGINIYTPIYVRADSSPLGFAVVPHPPSFPHMASPWLFVGPEALYWGPRHVAKIWNVKEIYITENGCSSSDVPAADGIVYDTDRVMYLRNYLIQLQRATADGVPVKGYFLWSLMDNFEWADGYTNRFGLHYVDYATQKRTRSSVRSSTRKSSRRTQSNSSRKAECGTRNEVRCGCGPRKLRNAAEWGACGSGFGVSSAIPHSAFQLRCQFRVPHSAFGVNGNVATCPSLPRRSPPTSRASGPRRRSCTTSPITWS